MSVKTCQLCGKPLGRIRNGEAEFCSPEHRNQFRLRRGMDRLEEANKVASLMRRRENPRQIPGSVLAAAGAMTPRGSSAPVAFPLRQQEPRLPASKAALFQVRVAGRGQTFCNPLSELARRSSAAGTRHIDPASLPFVSRPASPAVLGPRESTKPAAGVARAGLAPIPCPVPGAEGERKSAGAALRVTRRAALPQRRIEREMPAGIALEKTRKLQSLTVSAVAAGTAEAKAHPNREFEKRPAVAHEFRRPSPEAGSLPGSRLQAAVRPRPKELATDQKHSDIPRSEGILRLPRMRAGTIVTGARRAAPAVMRSAPYDSGVAADARSCAVIWEGTSPLSLPARGRLGIRLALSGVGNPIPVDCASRAMPEHRAAEVRFAPADSAFEPAHIELQGGFGGSGNDSARTSLEFIEEHFDEGIDQWMGDLVDWKLDAAGARPAGLALLRPTLHLGDYEFEFFTRIENRAVTFAFRAANVSNYLKVTIAMVESGRYELRRCAVIGGMEEPPASSPLPGVLRPGSAFTVKTRAAQNDFSIWLDGELAARWTDGRLPTGGIGFMAPRDDRARVYWVRLSQLDGQNSQAAAHRPVRSIQ